jgi:hypothetical protein
LASLNLPAALEDTSGNSLPQSLVDKASSVRDNGGIKELERMIQELPDLLQRNKDILDEVMSTVFWLPSEFPSICFSCTQKVTVVVPQFSDILGFSFHSTVVFPCS